MQQILLNSYSWAILYKHFNYSIMKFRAKKLILYSCAKSCKKCLKFCIQSQLHAKESYIFRMNAQFRAKWFRIDTKIMSNFVQKREIVAQENLLFRGNPKLASCSLNIEKSGSFEVSS